VLLAHPVYHCFQRLLSVELDDFFAMLFQLRLGCLPVDGTRQALWHSEQETRGPQEAPSMSKRDSQVLARTELLSAAPGPPSAHLRDTRILRTEYPDIDTSHTAFLREPSGQRISEGGGCIVLQATPCRSRLKTVAAPEMRHWLERTMAFPPAFGIPAWLMEIAEIDANSEFR
jgi:hypothetical protein